MPNLNIKKLNTQTTDFNQQLQALLAWDETDDLDIHQRVLAIIADAERLLGAVWSAVGYQAISMLCSGGRRAAKTLLQ